MSTLIAAVRRASEQQTFTAMWRGVLLNPNAISPDDTVAWSCGHQHAAITGKGSAMDCAVFEKARRDALGSIEAEQPNVGNDES